MFGEIPKFSRFSRFVASLDRKGTWLEKSDAPIPKSSLRGNKLYLLPGTSAENWTGKRKLTVVTAAAAAKLKPQRKHVSWLSLLGQAVHLDNDIPGVKKGIKVRSRLRSAINETGESKTDAMNLGYHINCGTRH